MTWRCRALLLLTAPVLLALGGGAQDVDATPISEIQFNNSTQGTGSDCFPSPLKGQTVAISGVVTGVARSTTHNEFWIQDSSGLWCGVYVYDRFDLLSSVAQGDTLSLSGKVTEYSGLTRIDSLSDVHPWGSDRAGPTPRPVTCADLGRGCSATGESFEGVLVRLSSVVAIHDLNANGEWYVRSPSGGDSCQIDDRAYRYDPDSGAVFGAIIGVVHYSNSEYEIDPRSASDVMLGADTPPYISQIAQTPARPRQADSVIVTAYVMDDHMGVGVSLSYFLLTGDTARVAMYDDGLHGDRNSGDSTFGGTIPAQAKGTMVFYFVEARDSIGQVTRSTTYSYTVSSAIPISDVQRPGPDGYASSLVNQVVTVEGVITAPPLVISSPSSQTASMYIQDATGGVNVYGGDKTDPDLALGEIVEVTGQVTEYSGTTEITTTDPSYGRITTLGIGIVPEPRQLIYNQFITEALEGWLVEFTGAVVDAPVVSGPGKNFEVRNGNSAIAIRVNDAAGINTAGILPGRTVRIAGIASQYDGDPPYDSGYQVLLRFPSDITQVADSIPPSAQPEILAISPNPFSPDLGEVVRIQVNAPVSSRMNLWVFDLAGRHVKTLLENHPGGHEEIVWDGNNEEHERVTIGMYLLHLGVVDPSGKNTNLDKIVVVGTPLH